MMSICEKNHCTGCFACKNICPVNAIVMQEDETGFLSPIIDESKCIKCGLCRKTCPVLNTKENIAINKCYVGYNQNINELEYVIGTHPHDDHGGGAQKVFKI